MKLGLKLLTLLSGGAPIPMQISGLVSWHDASFAAGLWQNSTRTAVATANADVIGAWDDRSGNGYHITQATTGFKPTLRTNIQNAKNGLRFDGADDFLSNVSYPDFGDNYSFFLVAKYAAAGDTDQGLFDVTKGTINTGFALYLVNIPAVRFGAMDASSIKTVTGGDLRDGVAKLHRGVNSGTSISYHVNTVAVATSATYTAPNPNTLNTLTVGRLFGLASQSLNGDIFEILIYNRTLTAQEISYIEAYANAKWGLY